MNFFFLLLLVVFWGLGAYSFYAALRGNEFSPSRVGLGDAVDNSKDVGDMVIGLALSIVGATFGAVVKLLFGRWGSFGIYMGQAAICLILGAVMLWLGIVFA
ncbi:MAG: hypothetical protein HY782_03380 [Chloroflexi bacterium]|nr:hypothetical protein [Chloroflexota bacterium]